MTLRRLLGGVPNDAWFFVLRLTGFVADVVLEVIDASNWREVLDVRVRDDQLTFVADHQPVALVILAKCFVRPSGRRWEPLLVRDGRGVAVGVFAVEHGSDGCELRNFAIDASRQGEGVGTAAAKAVIQRALRPESACDELVVSAHPENRPAHNAYKSAGFAPTNEVRNREPVFRFKIDRPGLKYPADSSSRTATCQRFESVQRSWLEIVREIDAPFGLMPAFDVACGERSLAAAHGACETTTAHPSPSPQ